MVNRLALAAVLSIACLAHADERTFRIFGSAGNEGHFLSANPASPLNPENVLGVPDRANSADLTAFAELVPESRGWKLHAKARFTDEDTPGHVTRGELGELYAQVSVAPWLDLTAGRKIEKWGTGYAWNPTGFVNPAKDAGDPNDRRSAYAGVDLLKADALVRGTSLSAYLLDGGWAFRAYRLIRGTDVSVQAADGRRFGVSFSKVLGEALEVHGEAARVDGHAEAVAGAQYTFAGNVNVVGELYHGGAGLSGSEWDGYRDGVSAARAELDRGNAAPLLEANRVFTPLQMGRNYAFLRVAWPIVQQRLDAEILTLTSLRDGSAFLRSTLNWKVQPRVALYVLETELLGGDGSEFSYVQVRRLFDAGVRIYF